MVIVALRRRRHTGWHRRLMLSAMSILTGPGIGRLLPMPLLMPHSWRISIAVTMIFPVIGMIADKRRHGRVHPAWWWSVGAIIVVQVAADIIAYSPWGVGVTEALVAGRSEEHTSELQSLMRISYAVFCLKKKKNKEKTNVKRL